jgi:hypothetical protein
VDVWFVELYISDATPHSDCGDLKISYVKLPILGRSRRMERGRGKEDRRKGKAAVMTL